MARKTISLRLDEGLVAWLDAYAASRGKTRTVILEAAVLLLREDSERAVPDVEPAVDPPRFNPARSLREPSAWQRQMAARQERVNRLGSGPG